MGENLSKESLQQAIEENRVLVLPARIGQTVYHYHLTCFDGCLFQKRKFYVCLPDCHKHTESGCGDGTPFQLDEQMWKENEN